jgi:Enoyl-(Acyl carrier protein) reductase
MRHAHFAAGLCRSVRIVDPVLRGRLKFSVLASVRFICPFCSRSGGLTSVVNLVKKKARDRTGNADNWREFFKPRPFGRACAPDEIGAMIAFLASERCSYNSGSVVTVDAGLSARSFNF